ncbi:hypothetical protein KVR01_006019 [Diaporthe batatas]|uniref:uncharacterized protein n=1 Tax=Diaporthe batatas TaxID=748121 RepID=UPI001D0585FE|nr:uncharacterized protein KVR01_006019 [Diaporthe batatas]KAG8164101.1 hypothetical protein KVR01_006019 [Diaporthe batatas]
MADADRKFAELISRQANVSQDAIHFYHSKRGWPIPDGFREWLRLAQEYGAILIEDFWDPIYEDLAPFWNMDPVRVRGLARQMTYGEQSNNIDGFWVRENKPGTDCQEDFCLWFLELLRQLVADGAVLPDVDIPVNFLITPRVIPPWEATQPKSMSTMTSVQPEILWLGSGAEYLSAPF